MFFTRVNSWFHVWRSGDFLDDVCTWVYNQEIILLVFVHRQADALDPLCIPSLSLHLLLYSEQTLLNWLKEAEWTWRDCTLQELLLYGLTNPRHPVIDRRTAWCVWFSLNIPSQMPRQMQCRNDCPSLFYLKTDLRKAGFFLLFKI